MLSILANVLLIASGQRPHFASDTSDRTRRNA